MIPAKRSALVCRYFDGYVTRLLARRFDRVWLSDGAGVPALGREQPLLVVMTHFSWWDVLVAYHLARRVLGIESYAPMDEAQLRRYRVLTRLGLYSINRRSVAGLRAFLDYTAARLRPGAAVWLTPQGEIAPSRRRPLGLERGVGHVVRRAGPVTVLPVAVVYEFREEPRPEIFVRIGPGRLVDGVREPVSGIVRRLEADLARELDLVQAALDGRALDGFQVLVEGRTGVSRVYDRVRRLRAWWTGRLDPARHGDLVSHPRRRRA